VELGENGSASRKASPSQKCRNADYLKPGLRYRRWLTLGPLGGGAPIIETENGKLMPWFQALFFFVTYVPSRLHSRLRFITNHPKNLFG
jgi:hypothetical protein